MKELNIPNTELDSWAARNRLGASLERYLSSFQIGFVGNIQHALPPSSRAQLASHTVPAGAYEGRMPWIAAAYHFPTPPLVFMQERPFQAEIDLLNKICSSKDLVTPSIVVVPPFSYNQIPDFSEYSSQPIFIHPFIGTPELNAAYTTPPAQEYNNKARMRVLMKENEMEKYLVEGTEVLATPYDTAYSMVEKVTTAVGQVSFPIARVKLGETASGLSTYVVDTDRFKTDLEYQTELRNKFRSMFVQNGKEYPADVVVEKQMEFGERSGYSDYGARGYLLPTGEFVYLSVGRVISTPDGVYQGMIMAPPEKTSLIGLSPSGSTEIKRIMQRFAQAAYKNGYWGPVNLDIFVHPSSLEHPGLVHDFNMRDGGSSASGNMAHLISNRGTVLDIDLKLRKSYPISESEGNGLIAILWEQTGSVMYSTTFLRYPKVTENEAIHSVKIISPINEVISSDANALYEINRLCERLNGLDQGTFSFSDK